MRLNESELILYLKELSLMLEAGFSLNEAVCELQSDKKAFKDFFISIKNELYHGGKLSSVFARYDNFDGKEQALIELGEENSKLEFALKEVIKNKLVQSQSKRQLKKALSYPLIVICTVILAFVFLVLFVIPKFEAIFNSFELKLPLITIFLINTQKFLSSYYYLLIISLIFLFIICKQGMKLYPIRLKVHTYFLYLPLIGKMISFHEKYFFFSSLGVLLKSGVPIAKALSLSQKSFNNEYYSLKSKNCVNRLNSGLRLDQILAFTGFFESFAIHMIKMGLKSRTLDDICSQIANYYEQKEEDLRDRVLSLLEPFATFLVALMVLFLALGIFLPMWDLSSAKGM